MCPHARTAHRPARAARRWPIRFESRRRWSVCAADPHPTDWHSSDPDTTGRRSGPILRSERVRSCRPERVTAAAARAHRRRRPRRMHNFPRSDTHPTECVRRIVEGLGHTLSMDQGARRADSRSTRAALGLRSTRTSIRRRDRRQAPAHQRRPRSPRCGCCQRLDPASTSTRCARPRRLACLADIRDRSKRFVCSPAAALPRQRQQP